RNLPQPRGLKLDHSEPRDVAAETLEPLEAPRAHQSVEPANRNSIALRDDGTHGLRLKQAQRILEHWTDLIAGFEHVDRMDFHQRFEPLRQRRLAAPDRSEQVKDLLALLQALRGMPEE